MAFSMDSRGPVSLDQLKRDTKRMTFGIELEFIAVHPLELFEDDERNARGDSAAALSLACLDRNVNASGHEDIDDDEEEWHLNSEPSYSKWCFKDEGGLKLSAEEREALPADLIDYMIQPLEVSSRLMSFEGDDW